MALTSQQKIEITKLLQKKIENKLKKYSRESTSMPFLLRLIQDGEKVASYSFIHSIATTLGMSIYEDVSVLIARATAAECFRNYGIGGVLSREQKSVIADIIRKLRNKERTPNIKLEKRKVLEASAEGGKYQKEGNIVDFYMTRGNKEYYFEIKTVKPNIDVFKDSKTKILEWVARKRRNINVFLAFPYNPYAPLPYSRFTMQNMMDHPNDFLVGEEYWDFLGGDGTYKDLLKLFDSVGREFRDRITQKIKTVAAQRVKVSKNL